ncbi:MAG: GyrI-like domain-containing protein [Burkholderiales bacterium]|nr:GyrI-like domain-containing protein [Burkholderiales bacterium]
MTIVYTQPLLVQHPGFMASGIEVRTSNAEESDPAQARINRQWHQFYRQGIPLDLSANAENGRVVGIYSHYENGAHGHYTVLAGVQLRRGVASPPEYVTIKVSAGEYIVFKAPGFGSRAVITCWSAIWDFFSRGEHELAGRYERAFTADFEVYGDPEYVSIYVSVKRKLGVRLPPAGV